MASLFTAGTLQEHLRLVLPAADFSTAAWPRVFSEAWGSASGEAFHLMVLPSDLGAPASSSGRRWGDGVKTRVEEARERSAMPRQLQWAQTPRTFTFSD